MDYEQEGFELDAVEALKLRNFMMVLKLTAQGRMGEFGPIGAPTRDANYIDRFEYRTYETNKQIVDGCLEVIRSIDEQLEEN